MAPLYWTPFIENSIHWAMFLIRVFTCSFWQDGSGGIWKADLSFSMTTKGPERLYECPAGPLRALVTCPTGTLMAATGQSIGSGDLSNWYSDGSHRSVNQLWSAAQLVL